MDVNIFEEHAYRQVSRDPLVQHRHSKADSYEIIQVLSGGGSALISDKTYPLPDGALLFIDASFVHSINPEDPAVYTRNKLILDRRYLERLLEAVGDTETLPLLFGRHGGHCRYPDPSLSRRIDSSFFELEQHLSGDADRVAAVGALLRLLSMASGAPGSDTPDADDRLASVLRYIRRNLGEPLTVAGIAAETHISKYYLCHMFRRRTGMTLMKYLYEQRFSAARRMLLETRDPIARIAQDCGFGSSSHLCTVFRRHEGRSPREFRNSAARGACD